MCCFVQNTSYILSLMTIDFLRTGLIDFVCPYWIRRADIKILTHTCRHTTYTLVMPNHGSNHAKGQTKNKTSWGQWNDLGAIVFFLITNSWSHLIFLPFLCATLTFVWVFFPPPLVSLNPPPVLRLLTKFLQNWWQLHQPLRDWILLEQWMNSQGFQMSPAIAYSCPLLLRYCGINIRFMFTAKQQRHSYSYNTFRWYDGCLRHFPRGYLNFLFCQSFCCCFLTLPQSLCVKNSSISAPRSGIITC